MNKLSSLNITGKNLVIRVDMNVPIKDGIVQDSTRIKACLPTIKYALAQKAKILLVSHLGRPAEGAYEEVFSLKPVAKSASQIFGQKVELIKSIDDPEIFRGDSSIQLLENIRFFDGEKTNTAELGAKLGNLGDLYVFDAFGTSHREQASTHSSIIYANKACSGILLEHEIDALTKVLDNTQSPYTAIIGGAKVSTKLELIQNINSKADHVIVGGGIANTFIKAAGYEVGLSLIEESMVDIAKDLLAKGKVMLPEKVITSETFEGQNIHQRSIEDIEVNEMILDQLVSESIKGVVQSFGLHL